MQQMTGTSATQPSHFVAHPDGARYEADDLTHNVARDVTSAATERPTLAEPLRKGK